MAIEAIDGRALMSAASVRNNVDLYVTAAERFNSDAEKLARLEARETQISIPESIYNVPIVRDTDELVRRAEIWLSAQGRLDAIEAGLGGRYTVLPLPNRRISHSQVFDAWTQASRSGDSEVMTWKRSSTFALRHPERQSAETPLGLGASRSLSEHVDFLAQWPADVLSGFDEETYEDIGNYKLAGTVYYDPVIDHAVRFVAIELAEDEPRLRSGSEELAALRGLQAQHPRLRSASLFEVGVLNQRFTTSFNYPNGFNDTFARAVELEKLVGECEDLPAAFIGEDGTARIGGIANIIEAPVRRAVA